VSKTFDGGAGLGSKKWANGVRLGGDTKRSY